MKAMQMMKQDRFWSEARAIMERYDLPESSFENVRGSLVHRAFLEEIQPFIKHITSVTSLAMPTYIRHEDGRFEVCGDGLTEKMRKIIAEVKATIEEIRLTYYPSSEDQDG